MKTFLKQNRGGRSRNPESSIQNLVPHERGVALVITLILLSVITFMAVTFLVVTRSEKGSVNSDFDQATAKTIAQEGVEQAKMQIFAQMLAYTNPSVVNLLVSTNYELSSGFINTGPAYTWFTNVSYHYPNGLPVSGVDALQNLMNQRYLPSPPVFVTNRSAANSNDFRSYLDVNRNGRFEPTGLLPVISTNPGLPFINATNGTLMATPVAGATLSNVMVGDPQWVGVLDRPTFPLGLVPPAGLNGAQPFPLGYGHSPSNRYVGRWAYYVLPTSLALDINYIHDYGKGFLFALSGRMPSDAFLRDMGVGSFEINLAAFLTDLNTNYWPPTNGSTLFGAQYRYDPYNIGLPNLGAGFEDAVALLRYRYNSNWRNNLDSVGNLFGTPGQAAFLSDYMDGYSAGPVMTGFHWPPPPINNDADRPIRLAAGWPGSDNPNHFFDSQDLFDQDKTRKGVATASYSLADRLTMAGTNIDTYNRYTFPRLLQQLGTDSAPDSGKMNLNYVNVDRNGKVVPDAATNFVGWTPVQFFTNAAIRMLSDKFSDTNIIMDGKLHIQVFPTNYCIPSVHRLLQVAANMYDFTTNRTTISAYPYCPSVFRPLFLDPGPGTNPVFIVNYEEVTNADIATAGSAPSFRELGNPADRSTSDQREMFYGIPLVVGAKKGFPNFNEFSLKSDVTLTRKLIFPRDGLTGRAVSTNQMFSMSVSNTFGVEAWNSYNTTYPRQLDMITLADAGMGITSNGVTLVTGTNGLPESGLLKASTIITTNWPSANVQPTGLPNANPLSFRLPVFTNYFFLPTANYATYAGRFFSNPDVRDPPNLFPVPQLWLNITNRVRLILIDRGVSPNRIVDYVNLESVEEPLDLMDLCTRPEPGADQVCGVPLPGGVPQGRAALFCTNRFRHTTADSDMPLGVVAQLYVSATGDVDPTLWSDFKGPGVSNSQQAEAIKFKNRLLAPLPGDPPAPYFQAPFNPYRVIHRYVSWKANDPLVHYTVPDMKDFLSELKTIEMDNSLQSPGPLADLGGATPMNINFRPWGRNGGYKLSDTARFQTLKNLTVKDPLIARSEDWDFPTNDVPAKYPNLGWLGRVHRGTPWQTIYLKAPSADTNAWVAWSGGVITNWDGHKGILYDSVNTNPTNDFHLLDLFTTAFNDNSSRGQLSVNQPNLAAWSAVLSGVPITSNILAATNSAYTTFIQPAGIYNPFDPTNLWPPVAQIVNGINQTRSQFPKGAFSRMGDILHTPELSTNSPYLDRANPNLLNDEVYERIPQQILSLLRGPEQPNPRFVIYAFGQALKPAERSIMNNGSYFGLCTNYQVTAETTVRAVVRVEGSPDPAQANNPDPVKRYPPRVVLESYNVLGPY